MTADADPKRLLLSELSRLPDDWALVAVGGAKAPYQRDWQQRPLKKTDIQAEIESGHCRAVGVLAGPHSGGLLFVDHDGEGAGEVLQSLGLSLTTLPKSPACTSGKKHRLQIIYRVPEQYWSAIATRKLRSSVANEQLELRWAGCQSVVAGFHPETGGYRWLPNRAPWEQEISEAPPEFIKAMLITQTVASAPNVVALPGIIPLENLLTREHRQQWDSGVGEGGRDDAAAALARDLLGAAKYCDLMGVRYTGSPEQLLRDFAARCSPPLAERDISRVWKSAERADPKPAAGIESRVGYWQKKLTSKAVEPRQTATRTESDSKPESTVSRFSQLQKYDVHQLCDWLKLTYENRIRYNVLLQQIEIDGAAIRNGDRFYVELAYQGVKASREMALDALAHVADQNPYDPVREYLERVEREVPPLPIDALATAYLRPSDQPDSLYDRMLKVTLIGAVKRAFEPGCTHQTACVFLGKQGICKSTFWEVLGGDWFDSSLGDLSSKDDLLVLHRSWIQEWGEIDQITGRKHAGQIKAFVSRPIDTFRKPYSRAPEAALRRGIIVGSTNRKEYLLDETGNRRFLTIPVELPEGQKIDIDSLISERDAIWAGAVKAYREGALNYLSAEDEARAAEDATEYRLESPWEPVIINWLASPDGKAYVYHSKLTTAYLLSNVIQKPVERQTRADQMAISDIMRRLGWEQKRAHGGTRYWAAPPED